MIDALPWDPEMESPATIAILGAGPMGIEAALYARFLGYHVSIFETRRVAHRMLDWNNRKIDSPAGQITTSLGLGALEAQDEGYRPPDEDHFFTGKQYAEEYLLPLAKTDLLFDDIHFLSPVIDISRWRSSDQPKPDRLDEFQWQSRCNDEFRILVQGRHRGTWVSRADCIIDCRGTRSARVGLGPCGGLAIGELQSRDDFLEHLPMDRKFDPKTYDGKQIVLVGSTPEACRQVRECLEYDGHAKLIWIVPPSSAQYHNPPGSDELAVTRSELSDQTSVRFLMIESLGVESISKSEQGLWQIRLLKDDESTVELQADCVVSKTEQFEEPLGWTLLTGNQYAFGYVQSILQQEFQKADESGQEQAQRAIQVITAEPGYFRLRADKGLAEGFERLRTIFAILGGRSDLDLYAIMQKQRSHQSPE